MNSLLTWSWIFLVLYIGLMLGLKLRSDSRAFVAHLRASPGKLSYGSAGSGSSPHIAGEMMKRQLGLFAVHVPYRGAAPALQDLLAGTLETMVIDLPSGAEHLRSGRIKPLALCSAARHPVPISRTANIIFRKLIRPFIARSPILALWA